MNKYKLTIEVTIEANNSDIAIDRIGDIIAYSINHYDDFAGYKLVKVEEVKHDTQY